MKTKLGYFSLFILFILPVQLHSEWSMVKNLYQGLNLNSISIINPGNIFIACDSASILKSTEAGVTWTRSSNIAILAIISSLNQFFSLIRLMVTQQVRQDMPQGRQITGNPGLR